MFYSRRGIQQCENRKKKARHSTVKSLKPWRRKTEKVSHNKRSKTSSRAKTKQPTIDRHVLQSPRHPAARKRQEKASTFRRSEALSRGDEKQKVSHYKRSETP